MTQVKLEFDPTQIDSRTLGDIMVSTLFVLERRGELDQGSALIKRIVDQAVLCGPIAIGR